MTIFIINTIVILSSFVLIFYNYQYINSKTRNLENRLKHFILSGIELFLLGSISIVLSMLSVESITLSGYVLIFAILSLAIYVLLLYLWRKLFINLDKELGKIGAKNRQKNTYYGYGNRLKGITIYGLMYVFSIFFYFLSIIYLFEI